MFPHFSLRRERSACLHKFLLLLVLSHSVLVLVWSFFGSVLFCMEGGAGRISQPLSFGCMFVGCRLVDVMMICDSRIKDHVFRPVVLYIGSSVLPYLTTYKSAMRSETRSMPTITHSITPSVGTENSGLDSEMFPPTWRLAAWLIECSRIGCFVRGKN